MSARHAAIPDSCVRYVAAMVDDVIETGNEVWLNTHVILLIVLREYHRF